MGRESLQVRCAHKSSLSPRLIGVIACIVSVYRRFEWLGHRTLWRKLTRCLTQVLDLGKTVKDAVTKQGMLAWQYNTIGVSDAITMGGEGQRFDEDDR